MVENGLSRVNQNKSVPPAFFFLQGATERHAPALLENSRELWRLEYSQRTSGKYRHLIALKTSGLLSDDLVFTVLKSMHASTVLGDLRQGVHFQWIGLSTIAFRSKENTVVFLLFMVVDCTIT